MTLFNELQERWKAIFLERESVEKRADELADDMQELEVALSALQSLHSQRADAEPDLFEDEKAEAREHLADDHPLPAAADDVVIEIKPSDQWVDVDPFPPTPDFSPVLGAGEESPDQFEERPALNEAMQDEREQPVEDGYAPVTNPEADQVVSAMSWYEPKAIAERSKFDPFGLFKREKEEA